MNKLNLYGFFALNRLRNLFKTNFFVNISSIKSGNKYYTLKNPLYIIMRLTPFIFLKFLGYLFIFQIIYSIDDIYFITNTKTNFILPLITNFQVNGYDTIDLTYKIKYYNANVPVFFFLLNNNVNHYCYITLNYITKGENVPKIFRIRDISNYSINDLFTLERGSK
jgi:hypothetical protein